MGNHDNERETADLNTAGAKTENEPIPAWAKIYRVYKKKVDKSEIALCFAKRLNIRCFLLKEIVLVLIIYRVYQKKVYSWKMSANAKSAKCLNEL